MRQRALLALALLLTLLLAATPTARAQDPTGDGDGHDHAEHGEDMGALPDILKSATFEQRNGEQIPLDLTFRNESGQTVALGDYFVAGKPTILTMNYYTCDTLCPLLLDGLVRGLNGVPFVMGQDYNVVTVSINPNEGPKEAAETKANLVNRYGRDGAAEAWGLLTGDEANIATLAAAAGVNFAYDEESQEYAHPSGVIILTPEGTISRYMFGIDFNPRDLRLGLVDGSSGTVGGIVDQVLLFCYHYDPSVGEYTPLVFNMMKLGGILTLIALAIFLGPMVLREVRPAQPVKTGVGD